MKKTFSLSDFSLGLSAGFIILGLNALGAVYAKSVAGAGIGVGSLLLLVTCAFIVGRGSR